MGSETTDRDLAKRATRHAVVAAIAALTLLVCAGAQAQSKPLDSARTALNEGRYADARRTLTPLADKKNDTVAKLLLAQVEMATGEYATARLLVNRALARMKDEPTANAIAQRARLEEAAGEYENALASYEKVVEIEPGNLAAKVHRGQLLLELGRHKQGRAVLDALVDALAEEYNAGNLDTDADKLFWLAIGLWRTEYYDDANDCLQEATKLDPNRVEAWVVWGELFLEKYNIRDASFAFQSALKVNPNAPGALLGMAAVHLESDNDHKKIQGYLDRALATNPNLPEAILLKARLQIDDEDYPAAIANLQLALAVNPNHLDAIALLGTAHYLADDTKRYEKARKRAFRLNPKFARFYTTVAELAVRVHRYPEAIELNRKALSVQPAYWRAFVDLGIGYTRIGDDTKGFEYLEKAYDNDPYNVRAYNMVNLYDGTLKDYTFVETDKLRFRFHQAERKLLEKVVVPLATEAYASLKTRYGYAPPHKTSVEIFRDVETFSIRSVGLPHISPHGICFGRVVTARSPREGNFNWAEVVWHELAHVFHIQMSGHRVPRWFTEGLAEFEAGVARPEWRREQDFPVMAALRGKRLLSVGELNKGFTRARSVTDIVAAYYQATLVIEFIVERWEFKTIRKMLKLWSRRKASARVIKEATGLDVIAFDAEFETWLRGRYATLLTTFEPWLADFADLDTFEAAAKKSPRDADAVARHAVALFSARRLDEAEARNKAALSLAPNNPHALFLGALLAQRSRRPDRALDFLNRLVDGGHDGYTIRVTRGGLKRAAGDRDAAIREYEEAIALYPRGLEAFRALSELHAEAGDKPLSAQHLEQVTLLNQNDFASAKRLANLHHELGNPADALTAARRAANIRPYAPGVHAELGKFALIVDEPEQAVDAFETEIVVLGEGPGAFPVWLDLARARFRAGDKRGARKALDAAGKVGPGRKKLDEVRRELGL